jgi:hypothetical protein
MSKLKKISLILGIIFLVIAIIITITVYYVYRQYPREWNYWRKLPLSVKLMGAELEIERLYYRVLPPKPAPERYLNVTPEVIERRMRLGADWLLKMQEPSGRFQYWYDPEKDEFSNRFDDNFLRQAGTSYSMALVYEMSGDNRYLEGARRNLEYLMNFRKDLGSDKAYFLFNDKAKLGGVSLPMLTMLKIRSLTGTSEYDEILIKLANMILFLQEYYGTGQFKSTYVYYGDYEYEKHSKWESMIYPGEALLALADMYRAFEDRKYKESIDRAMKFYSKKKYWKHYSFIPWTASAFVSMYEQIPDQKYADYALKLIKRLLIQQNMDSRDEVYGSFHGLPSANTGSYMESIADIIHLTQMIEDRELTLAYKERAKMAYRWLFSLQYTEDDVSEFKKPEMVIGGVRKDVANNQLRIDNTQHAISAFAKGLRYVFGKQPAVQEKIP